MKPTSFSVKTALLATLIVSGQTFAQSLPDEINHPQYLKIYQNAEQVLTTKTAELNKLAAQKAEIEKQIAAMVKDQGNLPARNAELQRLIDSKRSEISRINSDMTGLEAVLSQVIEDLRRIDALINQLRADSNNESARNQQINGRRNQVAQDLNRINARLQQEINEENQSINQLNGLTRGMNNDIQKRNEDIQEKTNLARDVDRARRELPGTKVKVSQNNQALGIKKPQLIEAQGKLPAVKAQVASEEAQLAQADSEINPKKTKLNSLKAELARLTPEVARLQKENADLTTKIESNKTKINASGLNALIAKRDALEKELSSVNAQIATLADKIVDLKEAIKPELGSQIETRKQIAILERSGANPAELQRLKAELAASEARLAPKRLEITRTEKQHETLSLSVAPKNQELANTKESITRTEATVAGLIAENDAAAAKIAANKVIIDERAAANSGLVKEINDLEAQIAALNVNRDRLARSVTQLKAQETQLTTQIAALVRDIGLIEAEVVQLNRSIAEMEKAIADYPLDNRRLENRISAYEAQINTARQQISREEKLLARIQQDRVVIEREAQAANAELGRVSQDLAQSTQLINTLNGKIAQESQNRESLTRYNQDSIRKYDGLKAQKASAESVIASSTQEIAVNEQDIGTIASELPRLRSSLATVTPKVTAAEAAVSDAQDKVQTADAQFQQRMSLYERYLKEAQALGTERANIGTADGVKTGTIEARTKATKLATENASAEAKWVAMRRGYIRGEIAGYAAGFDTGIASSSDAAQGDADGKVSGTKRAKDHANLVLKPEIYLDELDRRLVEDEVSSRKMMNAMVDVVSMKVSANQKMVAGNDVPELTQDEVSAAQRILTSLDSLIEQSLVEANQVTALRAQLSNARGVYTAPGAGENANNANCTGAYKNVKEFVDACKANYAAKYQGLYAAAHQSTFIAEYGKSFSEQIIRTFDAELSRLYPGYLKEASTVGNSVGVSAGKKEIYRQSFSRSEAATYSSVLVGEQARVEGEAIALVDAHLKANAALTVKGNTQVIGDAAYGIAPGTEAIVKMVVKNIGAKASAGNSLIKIKEASSSLVLATRETAIASVAAKSLTTMEVMKIKISDAAIPGDRVVLAGEIVHPGNDYRASRTEAFRFEGVITINPSIENTIDFDTTPKVSALFGAKKHDIDLVIKPKHEGVSVGYEVSIEEVGTKLVNFSNSKVQTERLNRNQSKKVNFEYKLEKAAKGRTINLKVTFKNDGAVVKTTDIQIKPE